MSIVGKFLFLHTILLVDLCNKKLLKIHPGTLNYFLQLEMMRENLIVGFMTVC